MEAHDEGSYPIGMAMGLLPTKECLLIPSPFNNLGNFFLIPIFIGF
jgi:hypothetical protein